MAINKEYKVNEGNFIGHQEPQALGSAQAKIFAKGAITKGMVLESTGTDWEVQAASDGSTKVVGIAAFDAADGKPVTLDTEGFVKLSASNASIAAGDRVVAAGNGYVKKMPALTISASPTKAEIDAALAAVLGKCGIVIAGCSANGNPYVKWSI